VCAKLRQRYIYLKAVVGIRNGLYRILPLFRTRNPEPSLKSRLVKKNKFYVYMTARTSSSVVRLKLHALNKILCQKVPELDPDAKRIIPDTDPASP
jgi:hypothetical protein